MSRPEILRAIQRGEILFDGPLGHVKSTSVDMTVGPWYWEETSLPERTIFSPNSRADVNRVWGRLCFAPLHWQWIRTLNHPHTIPGLDPNDRIILVPPGGMILCHSQEFIGGLSRDIGQMMKARSGAGRSFLELCRCAGWGDIRYHNRWTMEVNNSSRAHKVPLRVGQRYAQLVFFRTDPLRKADPDYRQDGKYQVGAAKDVRCLWSPEVMRPAMYKDFEARTPHEQRLYYRCPSPDCAKHGAALCADVPARCTCGSPIRVYDVPPPDERVFPLYDVCVECAHVHHRWEARELKSPVGACALRRREEAARQQPTRCDKCPNGYRHFLGGEYEVSLPECLDALLG